MKIFYIENVRLPTEKAHGIQIMKMCEAFARVGHEVELVVPRRLNHIKEDPFDYFDVERIFNIKRIPCLDLIKFGRVGSWVEMVTFTFFTLIYIWRRSDHFYTRDEFVAFCLNLLGRQVVWETHTGQRNFFVRSLIKHKIPIVAISLGLKNFYIDLGVPKDNICVAHDGVDLKQFKQDISQTEARVRLGLEEVGKIVMYVGRLDKGKGYPTFAEASKYLDQVQFIAIGTGDCANMNGNVKLLGYFPYAELSMNQRAADVLVIPNSARDEISNRFTSPMKLFAHMASGVPIVASGVPAIREILNDKNAYLFEPDNPKDLVRAIELVLSSQESSLRAKQALEDVKGYTWEKRAESIIRFIRI